MSAQRSLYKIGQLPIFQNRMYESESEARACPKGDVDLVEDLTTGLVYNRAFRPDLMRYDAHYQNEQAVSSLFRDHLRHVLQIVQRALSGCSIVEVGCGKGFFLDMLVAAGFDARGCDPTYEGDNPNVIKQYFEPGLEVRADAIVLRHVLEHVEEPYGFLQQIKKANGNQGKIYIEVPCFDWICRRRAWFDIFYEHVNYFRLSDFHRMFGEVYESGYLFGDQYLYVVADLTTLREPLYDSSNAVDFPSDFMRRVENSGPQMQDFVLWGGASKGVIFALLKERAGVRPRAVIDINPAKQGKYLPGTGLRVQSPEEALATLPKGTTIMVMNSNYLPEIAQMSGHSFNYVGIDDEQL